MCVDCVFGLDSAGMSRPSLEGVECLQETDMEAARFVAMFVAIFAALFVAIIFSLIQSGERWRAA